MTVPSQDNSALSKDSGSHLSLYAGVAVFVIIAVMVMYSYMNIQYQQHTRLYGNISEQRAIATLIGSDIVDISNNHVAEGMAVLKSHDERIEQLSDVIKKDITGSGLSGRARLVEAMQDVENIWKDYRQNFSAVLAGEGSLTSLTALLDRIKASIPEVLSISEEIAGGLVEENANARDIYMATRQLVLIQRIENSIAEVGRAGMIADEERLKLYTGIGHDSAIYEQTIKDMLATQPVGSMRDKLLGVSSRYQDVSASVAGILSLEPELAKLNSAIREMSRLSPSFIQANETLMNTYNDAQQPRNMSPVVWSVLGVGLLILISLLVFQTRAVSGKNAGILYEVNPRELVDFVYDAVNDMTKGGLKRKDKVPDQVTSVYLEDINNALEPVRNRTEFVKHTTAKILSISNGMHKSILNIVDAGDRLAQQVSKAGSTVENMSGSMRRAVNEAVSLKGILSGLINNVGAARTGQTGAASAIEAGNIVRHVAKMKQAMINLRKSVPEIDGVAGRIRSEAAKINMIALNTAIHADGDGEEAEELFAADEIQQHAHRIAGITRHLADLGTEFDSVTSHSLAEIESMASDPGIISPSGTDEKQIYQPTGESNAILVEKMQNVVKLIEYQFAAAGEASSCLSMLQEAIVDLSAGVNDIMAGVEALERLSRDLKGA